MDEKIIELLKEINNGKLKGAKRKLAKKLGVSEAVVGYFCNKRREPSIDMLTKLSKTFNKPEKELQKIFEIKNNSDNTNSFNNDNSKEVDLLKKEIELKNKEIQLLKREMELLKNKK